MKPTLTPRQNEVAELLFQGCSNKEIADRLSLKLKGVIGHLERLYERFDIHSRMEFVALWRRLRTPVLQLGNHVLHAGHEWEIAELGVDEVDGVFAVVLIDPKHNDFDTPPASVVVRDPSAMQAVLA